MKGYVSVIGPNAVDQYEVEEVEDTKVTGGILIVEDGRYGGAMYRTWDRVYITPETDIEEGDDE